MTARESTNREGPTVSRRGFLAGSAGMTFGLAFGSGMSLTVFDAMAANASFEPSAWISIDADGVITLVSPASEMGQGVFTAMPMLLAEELDADWTMVEIVQATHNPKIFGNPLFGNFMVSGASRTTRGYWKNLRIAGAQARRVLLDNVAEKWGVPVSELSTEPSTVVHASSGRAMDYGEVATFAKIPSQMPDIGESDLKSRSEWRIIGNDDITRAEIPAKVNGTAGFGIDTYVPGMLYASILRSPVQGNKPEKFNKDAVMAVKGVTGVIPLDYGVAVLGSNVWATKKGKAALEVTWSTGAKADDYDSDRVLDEYLALARDDSVEGAVSFKSGDWAEAAKKGRVIEAEYRSEHVYHAPMEPMNATARVQGDEVEIWTPTQAPSIVALVASKIAKTKPNKVKVNVTFLGGGFGRRVEQDTTVDAVLLSKITGKPVKVIWSREDDVRHDKFRPAAAQRLAAVLGDDGKVQAWRHRVVGESVLGRFRPQALKAAKGVDSVVIDGQQLLYDIPHQLHDYVRQERGIDVGFWRAVGPGYTKFAVETFIDELAAAAGKDPVEYRLSMLDDERARKVIETAAHMAEWGRKRPAGRAIGIAYAGYPTFWQTHIAEVAEISLGGDGKIRVHEFWAAVDPGVAVHPDNVVAQVEGGIIFGVSHALQEKITIKDGVVQQSNYHDYPVLRISDAPRVHVQVVASNEDAPGGMGEVSLPPTSPAIANAVRALTGVTLRSQPFTPEGVLAAMKA